MPLVVFGPCLHLGLSMRDLPTEQGIALLIMLIRHLRAASDQCHLLLIALSWWHLAMGTSYPLLEEPQQSLLHDQAHIFSAARQFLKTIHDSLHIPAITA
jgi:hypothetical protein